MLLPVAASSYSLDYVTTPKIGKEVTFFLPPKYVSLAPYHLNALFIVHKVPKAGTDIFLLLLEKKKKFVVLA